MSVKKIGTDAYQVKWTKRRSEWPKYYTIQKYKGKFGVHHGQAISNMKLFKTKKEARQKMMGDIKKYR